MSDLVGFSLLFGVAAGISSVAVLLVDRPFVVAGVAAVTSCLILLIVGTIQLGYMDPFAPIALVFGSLYAFPVALAFSLGIHWLRERRANHRLQLTGDARE